jgi:hypothetical protein
MVDTELWRASPLWFLKYSLTADVAFVMVSRAALKFRSAGSVFPLSLDRDS